MTLTEPEFNNFLRDVKQVHPDTARQLGQMWAARAAHRIFRDIKLEEGEEYTSFRFQQLVQRIASWDVIPAHPHTAVVRACRLSQDYGFHFNLPGIIQLCLVDLVDNEEEHDAEVLRMRDDMRKACGIEK